MRGGFTKRKTQFKYPTKNESFSALFLTKKQYKMKAFEILVSIVEVESNKKVKQKYQYN